MALDRAFDADTLFSLRKAVLAEATAAGIPGYRATDVMLAVHELAANAVRHGAGAGRLAMHVLDGRLYCQVSDAGTAGDTHSETAPARPGRAEGGHGLWILRAVADQVTVNSGPTGFRVMAVFTLPGSPP